MIRFGDILSIFIVIAVISIVIKFVYPHQQVNVIQNDNYASKIFGSEIVLFEKFRQPNKFAYQNMQQNPIQKQPQIIQKFHSLSPEFEENKDYESRIIEPEGGPQWIKCWECDFEDQAVIDRGKDNRRNMTQVYYNEQRSYEKNIYNDFELNSYFPEY